MKLLPFLASLLAAVVSTATALAGTYTSSAHGQNANRSVVDANFSSYGYAVGNCANCHEPHASIEGNEPSPPTAEGATLFNLFRSNYGATNRNKLCYACHDQLTLGSQPQGYGRQGVYQGSSNYQASVHDQDSKVIYPTDPTDPTSPGPTYEDAGNCHNCHDPHGVNDANGLIPNLLFKREETLCLTCHDGDGPASTNIDILLGSSSAKTYQHAVTTYSDKHTAGESLTDIAANKHVECVDCHNPHRVQASTHSQGSNNVSGALAGVNGAIPTFPTTKWTSPTSYSFTTANYEYEICFKCHSSANTSLTTWNSAWTDTAKEFNPNNSKSGDSLSDQGSYHSVVQLNPNRNTAIAGNGLGEHGPVFVNGWTTDSLLYCSDCHTNDTTSGAIGPHGSNNPAMLIAPYSASTTGNGTPNDLCFKCHDYNEYADWDATNKIYGTKKTGFSGTTTVSTDKFFNLHAYHVGKKGYTCGQCHVSPPHGSQARALLRWQGVSSPYDGGTWGLGTSSPPPGSSPNTGVKTWRSSGNWVDKKDCDHSGT